MNAKKSRNKFVKQTQVMHFIKIQTLKRSWGCCAAGGAFS